MPDWTTSGSAVFTGTAPGPDPERGPALNLPRVLGHNSLREQVSHALRAALIAGELRPGVVYSAPVLAVPPQEVLSMPSGGIPITPAPAPAPLAKPTPYTPGDKK